MRATIEEETGALESKEKIVCSGAIFYAKSTRKILYLQKANGKHQGVWSIVGGTTEISETPWQGLQREIVEEVGFFPEIIKSFPIETFVSNDKIFNFHTYLCIVNDEFIPKLSSEHSGYAWTGLESPPKPLHQGLRNSFSNKTIRNKLQTIFDVIDLI